MSFIGYARPSGRPGTRNYVGILSTVSCANDVAWWISQKVRGSVPFLHGQGCCQTKPDLDLVTRTLISLGWNPNLAAVLVVSLGCESVSGDSIAEGIARSGKPVERIAIQELGGAANAVKKGSRIARKMHSAISALERRPFDDAELVLGVKCGASDTTSGLTANPAVGSACDALVDRGASCIFGETTEFIGAEHILMRRAASEQVAAQIKTIVERMERRAVAMGYDMRGGQPTSGNIAGGLTTIEEKSLGAIVKSGTRLIQGVMEYGDRLAGNGLFIVDTPGREPEFLTALAAAGAQVVAFTTGLGAPQGFPFLPVIKITGNPQTATRLSEHIDLLVGLGTRSAPAVESWGTQVLDEVLNVASGKQTKAEMNRYGSFPNIFSIGPVI
jgi:altronate dehydratase large subunit